MTQVLLLTTALFTALVIAISLYFNDKISRFISIALIVLLANGIYFTFEGVKGWPTEDTANVKGILSAVTIVNPSDTDAGGIYVSIFVTIPSEWYEYKYHRRAPRTFYVKYTNDRAAKFEEAKQAMQEGKEVRINGIPPETSGNGQEGEGVDSESLSDVISGLLSKLLPKEKDTYKPEVPDVEIITPENPQKEAQ